MDLLKDFLQCGFKYGDNFHGIHDLAPPHSVGRQGRFAVSNDPDAGGSLFTYDYGKLGSAYVYGCNISAAHIFILFSTVLLSLRVQMIWSENLRFTAEYLSHP